jgi:hypothetical protein
MTAMARYWFKPKRYGFGATPSTWQGWALGAAYVATVVVASAIFLPRGSAASIGDWLSWVVVVALATAVTVAVSYRKTEGRWQWRWGPPKNLAD